MLTHMWIGINEDYKQLSHSAAMLYTTTKHPPWA